MNFAILPALLFSYSLWGSLPRSLSHVAIGNLPRQKQYCRHVWDARLPRASKTCESLQHDALAARDPRSSEKLCRCIHYIYIYIYVPISLPVYIYIYIYLCVCVCVSVSVSVCVCVSACVHAVPVHIQKIIIYTYIHTYIPA